MRKHRIICLALVLQLLLLCCANPALAYKSTTLRPGKTYSAEVEKMQEALIALGYLGGTPDGIFGNNTERAVRSFQRTNNLTADGLAGTSTLNKLYALYSGGSASSGETASETRSSASSESSSSSASESASSSASENTSSSSSSSSGSLFSSYATLRIGATGERVKQLQQALITLKYLSGSADGKLGTRTRAAVIAFQKAQGLTTDGLAGKKTLKALESALSKGETASSSSSSSSSGGSEASESASSGSASSSATASASVGSVRLLHWYNDIKPALKTGQHLLIVDPSSGLSWTLNLYSLGRHADAEPLTAEDTANMLKAFGGKNTWNQKAVYVKLPAGTWTVGSTHSMPHMSGSIDDNNFNGHLCVHFLRDMDECTKNDPNYGVANQNTIRAFWKSLTGEVVE